MELRDYQQDLINETHTQWNAGKQNILIQLATGGGKSVIIAHFIKNHAGNSLLIAHRSELISQLSCTLAEHGIPHCIIAPHNTISDIERIHLMRFGKCYINESSNCNLASIDTLIRRPGLLVNITLIIQDESHHVIRDNKWGKIAEWFPDARGVYLTATPERTDGKGLGRHACGVADVLIEGPSTRELMDRGYLTECKIYGAQNNLDLSAVSTSVTGEYNFEELREAVKKSTITGDVVEHYLREAPGKLGITFAVDISSAQLITDEFIKAGVPAAMISSQTPALKRAEIMQDFRDRKYLQLVNVDIFAEGTDIPEVEVVSQARPTKAFGLSRQQIGRCLRPAKGKTHGLVLDHVSNWVRHGFPTTPKMWSLDNRERRKPSQECLITIRVCDNPMCCLVYEKTYRACPYCSHKPVITLRNTPEQVDGDLTELDPKIVEQFRKEIKRIDGECRIPQHLPKPARIKLQRTHAERQRCQGVLRNAIAQWAHRYKIIGADDSEIYRRFFLMFKIDIMSAQVLNSKDSTQLYEKVASTLVDKTYK